MPFWALLKPALIAVPLLLGLWLRYRLLLTDRFRNGFQLTLFLFTACGFGWAVLDSSAAIDLGRTLALEQRWLNGLALMALVVTIPYLAVRRIVFGPWTPILCLAWTLLILPGILQRIPVGVADLVCLLLVPGLAFALGALHGLLGIALAGLNISLALASWSYGLDGPLLWQQGLAWFGWADVRLAWVLLTGSTLLGTVASIDWSALRASRAPHMTS